MTTRKRNVVAAAVAAGLLIAAASAGAQAAGAPAPSQGFSVENLLMELSLFMPEQYASFRGFGGPGRVGRPGGARRHGSRRAVGRRISRARRPGSGRAGYDSPSSRAIPS